MRVLVVEDEKPLAAAIRRGLEAERFEVDVVHDGDDAVWRASEGVYDAIVLDLLLPGRSGLAVCRHLRNARIWTPILVLTARTAEGDEAASLDIGADDYLRKPFSYVILAARLRALIRRGSTARPALLGAGSLTFDPVTRSCTRRGRTIALTPREASLLEALIRQRGRVAARSYLVDAVWGIDFQGDPSVVEVYVSYLRRKIDRPFGVNTLITVRGVGYQLVAD